jgi:uncharacterized protein YggE
MKEFFATGVGKWALIIVMVFVGLQALTSLLNLRYVGAGIPPANTITVNGYGETASVPDIATFTYSVVSLKSTVAAAQEDVTTKANAMTAYMKEQGIADRDIQTSNYSIYPQYDYVQEACANGICPGGRQVLRGYEVRQSTTVKVRDTAKAGDFLAGVGSRGATEVSGVQFTFDDPHQGENEAREKAIADAKAQANTLAKQLGVRIVRVVSFSESGGGYPYPIAYGRGGMETAVAQDAKAPVISTGENKVTKNVSVTYEIR